MGPILFSGFINDPDNIQRVPITFAGDRPERDSCNLRGVTGIQSDPEKFKILSKGEKRSNPLQINYKDNIWLDKSSLEMIF